MFASSHLIVRSVLLTATLCSLAACTFEAPDRGEPAQSASLMATRATQEDAVEDLVEDGGAAVDPDDAIDGGSPVDPDDTIDGGPGGGDDDGGAEDDDCDGGGADAGCSDDDYEDAGAPAYDGI